MSFVLPDSKGSIQKILYHQICVYHEGKQAKTGLLLDFLKKLNSIGSKPELYVFRTFQNNSEKIFLEEEANDWKPLAKSLDYVNISIGKENERILSYAQDTCLILDSKKPSAIITKSHRYDRFDSYSTIRDLLRKAGLQIIEPTNNFDLEGGYVYACSDILLFSNPEDKEIVKTFGQKPIFIENFANEWLDKLIFILYGLKNPQVLPVHVDLLFSVFEKEKTCYVFYVDFKEGILEYLEKNNLQSNLLDRYFAEWDLKIKKVVDEMRKNNKNVISYKMPGIIGQELFNSGTACFIYSGANLLFHSEDNNDYAFYLKFPSKTNGDTGYRINIGIESTLKKANIAPIAISGEPEYTNILEIMNSAGLRCLIKVVARKS